MAVFTSVRDGLADRLRTISGLEVYETMPGTVQAPAAVVTPAGGTIVRFNTSSGSHDMFFTVVVLVQSSDFTSAQENLADYMDTTGSLSIKAAIEGDVDLGNTAHWVVVTTVGSMRELTVDATAYLAAEFAVTVGVA